MDDSRGNGNSRELPIGAFRFLSARNAHHEASALDSIEVMILSLFAKHERRERETAAINKQTPLTSLTT